MSVGRFFIVGVGPGDPELITLKAARILAEADVIAYPMTQSGSFAAQIAGAHLGRAAPLAFPLPMGADAAEAAYDAAAQQIDAALKAGHAVALLCEGDPMLYGSAASIMARLERSHTPQIVPGITAASAAAAVARQCLGRGSSPFTILPANASPAVTTAALGSPGALVVYKVGRHFDDMRARIKAAHRTGTFIANATLPDERVSPLAELPPGDKPYFSAIIVEAQQAPSPRPTPNAAAIAVVILGPGGLGVAERAKRALSASGQPALIHGLAGRVAADEADVLFNDAKHHIGALFKGGTAVVGVCAAGILIRAVAPALADKMSEPPVVAIPESGATVVPLLGAHHGGTRLAILLCEALGATAAYTTRSEALSGFALDDPPDGFVVADPVPFKRVAAALTADDAGSGTADPELTFLPARAGWPADIRATIHPPVQGVATYIVRRVTVGMGAERGADPQQAIALVKQSLAGAGIDPRAVAVVASLDKKSDEPALIAAADALGMPLRVFDVPTLEREEARLATPSTVVRLAVGVAGVAEAAALAAAGPHGMLLQPKTVSGQLTIAIAAAPVPVAPTIGRGRGHLAVVGVGPGDPLWRTAQATALLAQADAFVGYSLYLDLVEDLRGRQTRHDFPLGEETERTRFALERAGEGRNVALISSGDPGIYAMASLAVELIEQGDLSDAARRVALTVAPGVSAAQAAAARIGAPFGHDFAYISLSDLLTPWPAIRKRLHAAAQADFAVALYNPRSRRRTHQLAEALAIFAAARPAHTPVVVASRLGRAQEAIHHTTLAAFDPETVDMLATVLIGASSTRAFVRGDGTRMVYTPRGYGTSP